MDRPLTLFERLRAAWERFLSPGRNTCFRCRRPWTRSIHHKTPYTDHFGISALCESCWMLLSPEERLPYYKALWLTWPEDVPWEVIRAAVLYERTERLMRNYTAAMALIHSEPDAWHPHIVVCGPSVYVLPKLAPEVVEAWEESRSIS